MEITAKETEETFSKEKVSKLLQKLIDKAFLEGGEMLIPIVSLVFEVSTAFQKLQELSSLKDLQNKIQSRFDKHEKAVEGAFDSLVKLYGDDINKLIEPVKEILSDTTWGDILKKLSSIESIESSKLVAMVTFEGIAVMILEYVFLTRSFLTLSAAENVSKNEQAFTKINENLVTIQMKIEEINNLFGTDPKSRHIDTKLSRINLLFTNVWTKISELEVEIEGRLQSLKSIFNTSGERTLENAFATLVSAAQLGFTWSSLNLFSAVLGAGVMAMRVGALVGNVAVHIISKEQLKAIKKDKDKVICLKEKYYELKNQVDQLAEERDKN